jgi:hypothetical protein
MRTVSLWRGFYSPSASESFEARLSLAFGERVSRSKAFTRLRRASHFPLLAQRKGNQRKGHPDIRADRASPARCPAVLAGHRPANNSAIPGLKQFAFPRCPAALLGAAAGDPRSRARLRRIAKRHIFPPFVLRYRRTTADARLSHCFGAHSACFALVLRVPCSSAEERSRPPGKGKLSEARDGRVVCRPVDDEHRREQDERSSSCADAGVPFSLVTFLLGKQEKVTRSPKASESPCSESDSLAEGERKPLLRE